MPLEIRELHIKVQVENDKEASPKEGNQPMPADVDQIISICVAQVMEILKEKQER